MKNYSLFLLFVTLAFSANGQDTLSKPPIRSRVRIEGGFTWRVNLTPIFSNNGFWPLYAGIGFGYAF